jgi:hypothetical protein
MKTTLALAVAALAIPLHAQVNRCVDANGKVTYSDAVCQAGAKGSQVAPPSSAESVDLQRERAQLARERFLLQQERQQVQHERQAPPPAPQQIAAPSRIDSYECQVAKQNLGIGASADSKMKSQRAYEAACFGDRAADVEKARAGATRINIRPAPIIIHR